MTIIGMPRVLLAIPVFNEAKSVDRVLTAVKPYIHDILMVDDNNALKHKYRNMKLNYPE